MGKVILLFRIIISYFLAVQCNLRISCRRFYHSLETTRQNNQRWSQHDKEGHEDVPGGAQPGNTPSDQEPRCGRRGKLYLRG